MAGPETQWVREHASKMDRRLRRKVLDSYRPPLKVPWWLSRFIVLLRQRRRRLPVIIQLPNHCSEEDCRGYARDLDALRCRHVRVISLIRGVSAQIPVTSLPTVVADSRVARVTYDRPVHALLDVAAPTVLAPAVWRADTLGEGIAVAVIDTGIYQHTDFTVPHNRIVGFKDFIQDRRDPYDDNGHGTHVAGIVAGNGTQSNGTYKGIAPGASLVGVKALNALGSGTLSTVIQGIEWSLQNKDQLGIRVLNLSLGAPTQDSYRDDPVAQAVGIAWGNGLVVCAAAGNDGPESRTIATPGIHPRVITIGASDDLESTDRDDDTVADFSSRGPTIDDIPKPDVVAPGVNITAANSPKSTLALQQEKKGAGYITLSGTSMATPVCSGIVALMVHDEPALTPDGVKERLAGTAESLGLDVNTQGSGLVDAKGAVEWETAEGAKATGEQSSGSR